jgi:hypothetical protein
MQIYKDQWGHFFVRPAGRGVHTDNWRSWDPHPDVRTLSPATPREIAKLRISARAIGYSIWDYMLLGLNEKRPFTRGGTK